jgi:hypothetical protein
VNIPETSSYNTKFLSANNPFSEFISVALTTRNPTDNVALIRPFLAENPCSDAAQRHTLFMQECENELVSLPPLGLCPMAKQWA